MDRFSPAVDRAIEANPQWAPMFDYVEEYLPRLIRYTPEDDGMLIGLPERYLVPTDETVEGFTYNELFYWDSFFMAVGLLHTQHRNMVVGIAKNLAHLLKRFRMIPNASRYSHMSHSQPPFFTAMA